MKLSYNIAGERRKSLVGAISQELNLPMKYLGAPSFAYEVGDPSRAGKYHIDKAGMVTGPDSLDLEDALHRQGFDAGEREYDEPDTCESGLGGMGALDEYPDIDQHHPGQYTNPDAPITEAMQRQLDEALESDRLVIEMPLAGFTQEKLENLTKLVNARTPLLKAALGAEELPIRQTDKDGGKLCFPWFTWTGDSDILSAYTNLIFKLCEAAKEKHHVTAKEREVENPKYAMRCWLLSLGFIGAKYKTARKILLGNLDGNSSYKSGAKKITEVQDDVSE